MTPSHERSRALQSLLSSGRSGMVFLTAVTRVIVMRSLLSYIANSFFSRSGSGSITLSTPFRLVMYSAGSPASSAPAITCFTHPLHQHPSSSSPCQAPQLHPGLFLRQSRSRKARQEPCSRLKARCRTLRNNLSCFSCGTSTGGYWGYWWSSSVPTPSGFADGTLAAAAGQTYWSRKRNESSVPHPSGVPQKNLSDRAVHPYRESNRTSSRSIIAMVGRPEAAMLRASSVCRISTTVCTPSAP